MSYFCIISLATNGEGNNNPLQYSCLENFMDRGAWRAIVHGVAKSRTRLSDLITNGFLASFSKQEFGSRQLECRTEGKCNQ